MASLYKMPISNLNGIGAKRVALFKKFGIETVADLLEFYPRSYEAWSEVSKIKDLDYGGTYCVKAVVGAPIIDAKISGGRIISKGTIYDETGSLQIVFFNNKYISSMIKGGKEYYFYGKVTIDSFSMQMVSPTFSDINNGVKIQPIYKQTAGLVSRTISNAVKQALNMLPETIKDPFPDRVRDAFGLCSLWDAIHNIHFPNSLNDLEMARKRLATEELVVFNLGVRQLKEQSRGISHIKVKNDYSSEFESLLPFEMTKAQKNAVSDCIADITKKSVSMNRLVQGDVGSGKTAVAASVCYTIAKNGYQTAFMVPTEILARQHYQTFCKLFENTDIKVALLTGSLKESEKKQIRQQLADGTIDMIIGTHTLITDKTEFSNLGLAVTDEQHRFGVAQRAKLISKGENPHLLVMSATPIPRTLGLIIFGDLDISVIDELPPSRKPIITAYRNNSKRRGVYDFIRREVGNGRQAYIVCPLVEEGELDDVASAEEYAAELMLNEFPDIAVGIVHGQMKSNEKDEVMKRFADNEYSILVATTVIEVGVDVPNASVILIENAERYGLSQLHQLRGRVGRGDFQSYCILMSDKDNSITLDRLNVMCSTNNGFVIADEDLKMRGPGDFFGHRQHGLPKMAFADFADKQSLALSQKIADYILFTYKDLRNDELRLINAEIKRLFGRGGQYSLN